VGRTSGYCQHDISGGGSCFFENLGITPITMHNSGLCAPRKPDAFIVIAESVSKIGTKVATTDDNG